MVIRYLLFVVPVQNVTSCFEAVLVGAADSGWMDAVRACLIAAYEVNWFLYRLAAENAVAFAEFNGYTDISRLVQNYRNCTTEKQRQQLLGLDHPPCGYEAYAAATRALVADI